MCYKGSIAAEERRIQDRVSRNFKDKIKYTPSYNINAFANPQIYIVAQDDPDVINLGVWGLVPNWKTNDPKGFLSKKQYTNNARGEDLYETPSYKDHVVNERCWILFDGFFEPHYHSPKIQQPYFCYIPEGRSISKRQILTIAGIYSKIQDEYYVSLITTEANDFFSEIHNKQKRMPLVLDTSLREKWLLKDQPKTMILDLVANGFTKDKFYAHPVSNQLYKGSNEESTIRAVEPFQSPSLFN
ncbi:putative SOS response-associated peptidase YedK [Gillisia mitskevichiae]|uniref:Abasic site processing protein n=1 Tax=Gillisia mitskevichiae TaxID=270921 RepID=A0A495PWT0_9FLAO|nr:SOS response-associated peptidase family protein [Gillisia mitskevichiae]RKS53209.1 putative SOS response-associated peptidase YedK [Gillisia mitskevichiae]